MNQYFLVKKLRNADEAQVYYRCPEPTMCLYFFLPSSFFQVLSSCVHTHSFFTNQRGSEN